MTDPESLIRAQPIEAPPPEIALAAVRMFRYRAVIALTLIAAITLVIVFVVAPRFETPRASERVAEAIEKGDHFPIAATGRVGDVEVTLWEFIKHGDDLFVHVLARSESGRQLFVRIAKPPIGTTVHPGFFPLGSSFSNEGCCGPTTQDSWFRLTLLPERVMSWPQWASRLDIEVRVERRHDDRDRDFELLGSITLRRAA